MAAPTPEKVLLKAFEGALREGLLLDEALSGILDAALAYLDASAVALLPSGGAPPITKSGRSLLASASETRLTQHLQESLAQGRASRTSDSGITFAAVPVKASDQIRGVFGVAAGQSATAPDFDETVRLFARAVGHVLERERTLGTLMKRREEAVALFELASGALHSLKADEVIRLTVASLARELDFDRIIAHRYNPATREVERLLTHGPNTGTFPGNDTTGPVPIEQDPLLVKCLAANGPAFEDDPESTVGGSARRRRMSLPLATPEAVFGFLTMSRRGSFSLTPQEMRLAQELSKLAAGALEKARLLESERREAERATFIARVHAALAGLTDVQAILTRTVEEAGPHLDLDLFAVRLSPIGELPGGSAIHMRGTEGTAPSEGIPDALLSQLSAEGSRVLLPDVLAHKDGLALIPAPGLVKNLPRPISLLAVPLASQGAVIGVLAAVTGGRGPEFVGSLLRSFETLAIEVSLAVTAARLLVRERESRRFLERLREVGRQLTTTFDEARIKQILCEQSATLLRADAAQFWDADPANKVFKITIKSGNDGSETGKTVSFDHNTHPVVKAYLERGVVSLGDDLAGRLLALPLIHGNDLVGVLSLTLRKGSWIPDHASRLSLLADSGTIALHNARLIKAIERQTERDAPTGLYKKSVLLKRLEQEIRRAERNSGSVAFATLHVHGLNEASQKLGSVYADALLPKVAGLLLQHTRAVNVLGRDRFDRFLVLLVDATKVQAQKAIETMQKGFVEGSDARHPLVISAGIAAYPEDAFDASSLALRAEESADDAVRMGPGHVVLYGAMSEEEAEL